MSKPTHYVIPADWWTDYGLSDVMADMIADGNTKGEAIPVDRVGYDEFWSNRTDDDFCWVPVDPEVDA